MVRRVEPVDAVPAATVLAWCAYLRGQGALAAVVLDLVAEADPDYSLAQLLVTMLDARDPSRQAPGHDGGDRSGAPRHEGGGLGRSAGVAR